MSEQIMTYGRMMGLTGANNSFALISDGYFEVAAYIPAGMTVQLNRSYMVYKQGNTYYVGNEVNA